MKKVLQGQGGEVKVDSREKTIIKHLYWKTFIKKLCATCSLRGVKNKILNLYLIINVEQLVELNGRAPAADGHHVQQQHRSCERLQIPQKRS